MKKEQDNDNYTLKDLMDILRLNLDPSICTLNLSNLHSLNKKKLGPDGGAFIAHVLESNTSIHTLILKYHNICDDGVISIANMLRINKTIQTIDFSNNNITDIGIKYLASVLYGHDYIKYLKLDNNNITDIGAKEISNMLRANSKLTYLSLKNNHITCAGAMTLLEVIRLNAHSLKELFLTENDIPLSIINLINSCIHCRFDKIIPIYEKTKRISKICTFIKKISSKIHNIHFKNKNINGYTKQDIPSYQEMNHKLDDTLTVICSETDSEDYNISYGGENNANDTNDEKKSKNQNTFEDKYFTKQKKQHKLINQTLDKHNVTNEWI